MPKTPSPMVMRSVYLPEDMDLRLRQVAFLLRKSKADLIRAFVGHGLARVPDLDRISTAEIDKLTGAIFSVDPDTSPQEDAAFLVDSDRVTASTEEAGGQAVSVGYGTAAE